MSVHTFTSLHKDFNDPALILDEIEAWLHTLPRPCALFACSDPRALHISQACEMAGIQVPQEISILGVDDEEYLTSMYGLALSSIAQDAECFSIDWNVNPAVASVFNPTVLFPGTPPLPKSAIH